MKQKTLDEMATTLEEMARLGQELIKQGRDTAVEKDEGVVAVPGDRLVRNWDGYRGETDQRSVLVAIPYCHPDASSNAKKYDGISYIDVTGCTFQAPNGAIAFPASWDGIGALLVLRGGKWCKISRYDGGKS